ISMGYELLPAGLGDFQQAGSQIRAIGSQDASEVCKQLKASGSNQLATFVKRAHRTLVEPNDLADILDQIAINGLEPDSFEARILLSRSVVQHKQRIESTKCFGFKLNAPSIEAFDRILRGEGAQPAYVFITRDPRDIVASHFEHGFNRTIEHICTAWKKYLANFLAFREANPDQRCELIRYEDLVCEPDSTIAGLLQSVGFDASEEARRFYEGKASVHSRGHRNQDDLKQDVYTNQLARWTTDLTADQILQVQSHCSELMERMNYFCVDPLRPFHEPDKTVKGKMVQMTHKRKKKFYRNQYAELIDPLVKGRVNLTWAEACRHDRPESESVVILRHDVDHDLETALQMARWEHERGLRATYCILHTAWYYGRFTNGVQERSKLMLDGCRELQELGHEINIHNNFIVQ
ncbi:MAG: sulfotransferase, partial [Phycisphaerales bacterium]|nr:sulfotransferase [Phycisphaerales bacterium]